jgi:hypothetical protein
MKVCYKLYIITNLEGHSIIPEGIVDYVCISLDGDMYVVLKRPVVAAEDC